jgi:NADPH:quinone reductase-like Zn-dependent oxidoreductase
MRAAVFHENGGPEVLRIEEVEKPVPGRDEVLVEVRAAGLNHLDLWVRRGLPIKTTMPHIGGSDVAGVVVETGPDSAGSREGTRVVLNPSLSCGHCEWCMSGEDSLCAEHRILGEHTQGGFAEYVVAPARNVYPIPAEYDFVTAAAAPLAFLTAWRGLVSRGRLRAGETVLITGASGGVATAAVQIARLLGATIYAVTTTENVARVRDLGGDVVYDRNSGDFSKQVWQDTKKRGVDLIFDSVGAATWKQNLRSLARGGRLVVYGATTGPIGETDLRVLFSKQADLLGTTMSNAAEFRKVMAHVFSGRLQPVVDRVFPLAETRAAHEYLEAGAQFGKVVVKP